MDDRHAGARIQHEAEDLLALAEEAGDLGVFEWQVREGVVRVSAKLIAIYGLTNFDGRYESWLKSIYREDLVRLTDLTESAFAARAPDLHAEFRIVRASDGELRWIEARRIIFYDEEGPVRVVGVSRDVTEPKRALVQMRNSPRRSRKRSRSVHASSKPRTRRARKPRSRSARRRKWKRWAS